MRKLLNTLYVTTPETYLSKDGMNVVASVDQKEIFRIPIINIESIVTFGYMGASPGLMKLCADNDVSLTFLSPYGNFIGRFQGPTQGNVLLRIEQYRFSGNIDVSMHYARLFIAGKIQNYRSVLRRFIRDYGNNAEVDEVSIALDWRRKSALKARTPDELRGVEGEAANLYFSVMDY